MHKCYIFDIDGTIADLTHRLPHIQSQPKNWDAFFAACEHDEPIAHMHALARSLWDEHLVYVSGRPERTRAATIAWLLKHNFPMADALYMRADGDRRDDSIVKLELLHRLRADGFEPILAFDDRQRVVDMWRANGVPCAQVAPGDF